MADEQREVDLIVNVSGADNAAEQVIALQKALAANSVDLLRTKQYSDKLSKEYSVLTTRVGKLEKSNTKLKKENKELSKSYKKQSVSLKNLTRNTIDFVKNIATLNVGVSILGVSLGAILDDLSSYYEDTVRSARVTSMFGENVISTEGKVNATAKALGFAKDEIFAFYNEFQRTNVVIDTSADNFVELAKIIRQRVGGSLKDIQQGFKTFNEVAEQNYGIYQRVREGFKATSNEALGYYMVLTRVQGASHDAALRAIEMANGFNLMTEAEKEAQAQRRITIEANKQLRRSIKDLALMFQEKLAPAMTEMAIIIAQLIPQVETMMRKLTAEGAWANFASGINEGIASLGDFEMQMMGFEKHFASDWLRENAEFWEKWGGITGKTKNDVVKNLKEMLKEFKERGNMTDEQKRQFEESKRLQELDTRVREINAEERRNIEFKLWKEINQVEVTGERQRLRAERKFGKERLDFVEANEKEILLRVEKAEEDRTNKVRNRKNIQDLRIREQQMERLTKANEALIDVQSQEIDVQAKLYGEVDNLGGRILKINQYYEEQISLIQKTANIQKSALAPAMKEAELHAQKQADEYGEFSVEAERARNEVKILSREMNSITAGAEKLVALKTFEKMEVALRNSLRPLEEQKALRESISSLVEAEMSLQEQLMFGLGANLQARLKTVESVDSIIKNLELQAQATRNLLKDDEKNVTLKTKLAQIETERVRLISKQVDLTKELREGYLTAIEAAEGAMGDFEKIIQRQDFGIRDLLENFQVQGAMAIGAMGQGLQSPQFKYVASQGMGGALQGTGVNYDWIVKNIYGGRPPGVSGVPGSSLAMTPNIMSAFQAAGMQPQAARDLLKKNTPTGFRGGATMAGESFKIPPAMKTSAGGKAITAGILSKVDMSEAVRKGVKDGIEPLVSVIKSQGAMVKQIGITNNINGVNKKEHEMTNAAVNATRNGMQNAFRDGTGSSGNSGWNDQF